MRFFFVSDQAVLSMHKADMRSTCPGNHRFRNYPVDPNGSESDNAHTSAPARRILPVDNRGALAYLQIVALVEVVRFRRQVLSSTLGGAFCASSTPAAAICRRRSTPLRSLHQTWQPRRSVQRLRTIDQQAVLVCLPRLHTTDLRFVSVTRQDALLDRAAGAMAVRDICVGASHVLQHTRQKAG